MKEDERIGKTDTIPTDNKGLPPPPERPDPADCCGGGCIPCIFDFYEEALERWEKEVAEIKAQRRAALTNGSQAADKDSTS